MKIIHGTESSLPPSGPAAGAGAAPDLGRLDALEKIAKSILQKLQALEERMEAVEEERSRPASVREPSPAAALDPDAVKKGLMAKMWKYLNDESASKPA